MTPSSSHLLVFTSSLSLRIYELPDVSLGSAKLVQPIRIIPRSHDAPIHVCKADPTSTYVASGSADGVVKVWNILRGYVTHVFKGHGGVVSALAFDYPQDATSLSQESVMRLITASVDTRIRIFNLNQGGSTSSGGGKPEALLEGHVSVPRGLDVSFDGRWLVSGGRDSVVLIWDLSPSMQPSKKENGKTSVKRLPILVRTIPVLERVEAVGILSPGENLAGDLANSDDLRFFTGGEKGIVKIWDGSTGKVLFKLGTEQTAISHDHQEQRQIVDVLYVPSISTIVAVHADQNILFHSLATGSLSRQLIGYNDEIVDATFLSPPFSAVQDSHLALATNSSLIRVYSTLKFDARLLDGHSDIVLALDHGQDGALLASGSKDRTARLWVSFSGDGPEWGYGCVAVCEGHSESIGAVALSRGGGRFMFTGSQDRTIKMWDLSDVPSVYNGLGQAVVRCGSLTTHKAHEKDINSLDVSPDDRFLVSGSQDRTAKVYTIIYSGLGGSTRGELKLLGTCKGHKRGIWSVRFSRTERVLATGSGDKSIKLWSLDDFSCLKTFEGHTNSVLRVDFLNAGLQLVSTASDGLVKLWSVREEDCVATLDNHEDKVWALAITTGGRTIVSGAADSVVTFWEDCTEEQEAEKEEKRAEMVLKDQDFLNFLSLNDYRRAIQLALSMDQPGRILSMFRSLEISRDSKQESNTWSPEVDKVIQSLGGSDLAKLIRYVRDWNTNAKSSAIAQTVLFAIFKSRPANNIIQAFSDEYVEKAFGDNKVFNTTATTDPSGFALKEMVDALIPYSERHLSRMERLYQESFVVDYILGEMDEGMFNADVAAYDEVEM